MSTHFEWLNAATVSAEFVPHGYDVREGSVVAIEDGLAYEDVVAGGGLLLSNDEVVVIQGTPEELRAMLLAALALLPTPERTGRGTVRYDRLGGG